MAEIAAGRVAALYDIHGNLPALEAVLSELDREPVDRIVVGGDVVLGPMSREVLACLAAVATPISFIQGNCETAVLDQIASRTPAVPEQVRELVRWEADRLGDHQEFLAGWPLTMHLRIDDLGRTLFCHATPRNNTEIFTRRTPDARVRSMFENVEASVAICGHTHMQQDRTIGDIRIVNAGSVGMPFAPPGAYWTLLGPGTVELRRTSYDFSAAAERVRRSDYPQADQFAATNILQPPSEEQMLEAFSGSATK